MMYNKAMIRTQIYLREGEHKALKQKAKRDDITLSEAVREFIRWGLERDREAAAKRLTKQENPVELLLKSIGRMEKGSHHGPADLSTSVDQILYGTR